MSSIVDISGNEEQIGEYSLTFGAVAWSNLKPASRATEKLIAESIRDKISKSIYAI